MFHHGVVPVRARHTFQKQPGSVGVCLLLLELNPGAAPAIPPPTITIWGSGAILAFHWELAWELAWARAGVMVIPFG